jgi:hypothetical protein
MKMPDHALVLRMNFGFSAAVPMMILMTFIDAPRYPRRKVAGALNFLTQ